MRGFCKKAARRELYGYIKELHEEKGWSIAEMCKITEISRSSYYKWLNHETGLREQENERLLLAIRKICERNNFLFGFRKMTMALNKELDTPVNKKRIHRLMRIHGIESVYRKKRKTYPHSDPEATAENKLKREFEAERPNQKWATDVTEIKAPGSYGQKLYISSIMDLYDRTIIACVISRHNDVQLINDTLKLALERNPEGPELLHSDRGFQYTRAPFQAWLKEHDIEQSMSRVSHCIDNGPMEGIQGILKDMQKILYPEAQTWEELEQAFFNTIDYYHYSYPQERFHGKTAMEVRKEALQAVEPERYPIKEDNRIIKFWDYIEEKKLQEYSRILEARKLQI